MGARDRELQGRLARRARRPAALPHALRRRAGGRLRDRSRGRGRERLGCGALAARPAGVDQSRRSHPDAGHAPVRGNGRTRVRQRGLAAAGAAGARARLPRRRRAGGSDLLLRPRAAVRRRRGGDRRPRGDRVGAVARYEPGLADFGGLVAALEPLAAALHRSDELGQVHLERVEDLVGVVLRAEPDLALARPGVLDDVLRRALGLAGDLLLGDELLLALARLLDDALRLAFGLGEHLLTFLDDPASLLDLLRDRGAHLVEDVVDLLLVDAHGIRQRHRLGVVDEVVQLVDQYEDVHGAPKIRYRSNASFKRRATSSGTSLETSPPNVAISFTPLEDRKLYWGDAIR